MPEGLDRDRWERLLGGSYPLRARHSWRRRPAPAAQERWALSVAHFGDVFEAIAVRPRATAPGPVIIVPFYETASLLGDPCERTADRAADAPSQAYARMIADQGGTAVAVPWWFELHAVKGASDLETRYGPASREHESGDRGGRTPLGRSIADIRAVIDAVEAADWLCDGAIGMLGHSLGAKLALHAAALDERVGAVVLHEPGIGFAHSNWDALWYLGDRRPQGADHDELLALLAPRPVQLIGGGASDGAHNAQLVARARRAWPGDGSGLVVRQHGGGHPWPEDDAALSVEWLLDALRDPRSP